MAPRPDLQASGIGLLADLHLTVDDGAKAASAHLTGGLDELVLDVDHPVVMLRSVPRRAWSDSPGTASLELLAGASVRVTSQGTTLGRLRISSSGRPRFRPSLAALTLPARSARSAAAPRKAWLIGSATLALIVTATAIGRFRRRP